MAEGERDTRERYLWRRLEAYHGLIYFVPEADAAYTDLGLDAGIMGYFASRSAPMGATPADVVIATFYNFEPERIRRVIPPAWERTTPSALCEARSAAVDAALKRLFGDDRLAEDDVAWAADTLRRITRECRPEGRPLFAGHASLDWPDEPHLALWHAISLLREHRGDGHIAALTAEGVGGCEALVLHGATGAVPAKVLQSSRGWSDDAWESTKVGLVERGLLDHDDELTTAGAAHRSWVEERTDQLAAAPWATLTDDEADRLAALGRSLAQTIVAAGTFARALP